MREKKGKTNKANKYTTQPFLNDQKTRNPNKKKQNTVKPSWN